MLIGSAGHIDHGKTTLLHALTGVDADRLPQEKERGITLDLGYAYAPLGDGATLGFVDVPGHEKLIRNMLAGAKAIDFALLVIAADDGPMPQTIEHLELLDLIGIRRGAVALTKIDSVDPERLDEVVAEIADLVAGTQLAGSPVFRVASPTGDGVPALRAYLETTARDFERPPSGGRFRMAIDRAFSLKGVGTVVTGTALAGQVRVDDTLAVSPAGATARVRGLHVQDRPAESGQAGERCAVAIKGDFDKKDIERGMWLVDPALADPLTRFQADLRVPRGQRPVKHMQSVHVHIGTDDIMGRVALLDCKTAEPGQTALAEILLQRETLTVRGDPFVLRDAGATRTVAGGRTLDIFPPKRHKRHPFRLELLDRLRDDDPANALSFLAAESDTGVDLAAFARNWNLDEASATALWQRADLRVIREGHEAVGIGAAAWDRLRQRLLAVLAEEHERAPDMIGIEPGRLRRMVSVRLSPLLFRALTDALLEDGAIALTRAWLHLPEHRAQVSQDDRERFALLEPLFRANPYNPPRVRYAAREAGLEEGEVRQLYRRLARAGELFPVARDHYFTAEAVAELAGIVRELAEEEGAARAAPFRDRIYPDGSGGRKVTIHILEFFDRVGYTRRVHDDHVLREDAVTPPWRS
ncbi:MAG: selenocysteine-specific translation elongation factor [Pseudomonadota bacterium]